MAQAYEKTVHFDKRYPALVDGFERFYRGSQFLINSKWKIPGFLFEPPTGNNYFDVFFAGMRLRFQMVATALEDGSLLGTIYCLRITPKFKELEDVIGSFTYNGQGITDFEVEENKDRIEIEHMAPEIIVNFINLALLKPLV
ncbi:MAG: hypothetical protein Q8M99_05630 [Methylotenera sp.]|nr:hypothetical protein [Methylotenera sp.]